jgi:hypothetical protein
LSPAVRLTDAATLGCPAIQAMRPSAVGESPVCSAR